MLFDLFSGFALKSFFARCQKNFDYRHLIEVMKVNDIHCCKYSVFPPTQNTIKLFSLNLMNTLNKDQYGKNAHLAKFCIYKTNYVE